jgi:hypothetical protein
MWINGCYAGQFPAAGGLRQIQVSLPADAAIKDQALYQRPAIEEKYCALDIRRIAKPGALREARVLLPGIRQGRARLLAAAGALPEAGEDRPGDEIIQS